MITLGGKHKSLRVMESGKERVVVGDDEGNVGVQIKSGEHTTISLDERSGAAALRAFSGDDLIAAVGGGDAGIVQVAQGGRVYAKMIAAAGGGAVNVYDPSGAPRASMTTLDNPGEGLIVLRNSSGMGVAYLTHGGGGEGGNLTVTDPSGEGVFSAGAARDGLGEACVTRAKSGGSEGTYCLGIGLPGMGTGQ
jgi:hypothetical protein